MPVALPPISTADFLGRLGVNVHVEYTDGKYANVGQVVSDLSYLGVGRVRDENLDPANQGQGSYDVLAQAGIRFDLFVNPGRSVAQTVSLARAFALAHPGAVESIEGPNEVNNWPVTYNGQTGTAGAQAYQSALYSAVKSDGVLGGLPVFNFTDWPDAAGAADFATYHSYPKNGDQPWNELSGNYANQAAVMPGKPMVLTETGYYTLPNGVGWGGVDQPTQAKQTLNLLMDAVSLGVQRVYLYQLLDAYADPQSNDQEKHFGLFDINNQAKTAAFAIHNLTSILAGGGGAVDGGLGYSVAGLPASGASLELQKAPGVYDIVVWNEPDIWNQASHTPINTAASTVTLNLAAAAQYIDVYDPLSGAAAVGGGAGSSLQLSLTDHPLIIEVTLPSGSGAPASPPTVVTITTTGPGGGEDDAGAGSSTGDDASSGSGGGTGGGGSTTAGGIGYSGDFAYAVSLAAIAPQDDSVRLDVQSAEPALAETDGSAAGPAAETGVIQTPYYWDRYASDLMVGLDGSTLTAPLPAPPSPAGAAPAAAAPDASAAGSGGEAFVTFVTTGPGGDNSPPPAPPPAAPPAGEAAVSAAPAA